jgi:hypothetical protein
MTTGQKVSLFVAGWCCAMALVQAEDGRAWLVLLDAALCGVNLAFALVPWADGRRP